MISSLSCQVDGRAAFHAFYAFTPIPPSHADERHIRNSTIYLEILKGSTQSPGVALPIRGLKIAAQGHPIGGEMPISSLHSLFTTGPGRLSDTDWKRVQHLFPASNARGRPRVDARHILDAVLWACFDEHKWKNLPASYPPQQTCYSYFLAWRRSGVLTRVAEELDMPYEAFCAIHSYANP
jgi:hypothetical protein